MKIQMEAAEMVEVIQSIMTWQTQHLQLSIISAMKDEMKPLIRHMDNIEVLARTIDPTASMGNKVR